MIVAQRATNNAPIKTGRLGRSITSDKPKQVGPLEFTVDVGTNVEYARAHELGSGLHSTVGPKEKYAIIAKGRALEFSWPNAPAEVADRYPDSFPLVYYKSVMHPGIRPTPYLTPAINSATDEIRALILSNIVLSLTR